MFFKTFNSGDARKLYEIINIMKRHSTQHIQNQFEVICKS